MLQICFGIIGYNVMHFGRLYFGRKGNRAHWLERSIDQDVVWTDWSSFLNLATGIYR